MGTQEFIQKLASEKLSSLDSLNMALELTGNDPKRIPMLIHEMNDYVVSEMSDKENIIDAILSRYFDPIENKKINYTTLSNFEKCIIRTCESEGFKKIEDLPDRVQYPPDKFRYFNYIKFSYEEVFYMWDYVHFGALIMQLIEYCEPQPTPEKTPFRDQQTAELFEYIVKNWNYDKQQQWADIWNVIHDSENFKAPYQNEYQAYVIQRFKYTGRFQYDKVRKPDNRHNIELLELIKNFSKK